MSRLRSLLRSTDDTEPWSGAYAPYDLIKEVCIAVGVTVLLAVLLAVLFSSPDEKPSTIKQWSRQLPQDFITTAVKELDGSSAIAEYGPPYNHNGEGQHAWVLRPQKWLGVSHPINTAQDFVIGPLETVVDAPSLHDAIARYRRAPEKQQKAWGEAYAKPLEEAATAAEEKKPAPRSVSVNETTGTVLVSPAADAGPVPTMMNGLLALAKSGGVDGALLTSGQFFQTDYTKPLLFMSDGGLLAERAEAQHLLGDQWGLMNETGSYPGQAWLWLYALWYQVEPIKSSPNADILVLLIMGALSLALVCIPFIPGLRDLPRRVPIYKLIWREHYRSVESPASPSSS